MVAFKNLLNLIVLTSRGEAVLKNAVEILPQTEPKSSKGIQ